MNECPTDKRMARYARGIRLFVLSSLTADSASLNSTASVFRACLLRFRQDKLDHPLAASVPVRLGDERL